MEQNFGISNKFYRLKYFFLTLSTKNGTHSHLKVYSVNDSYLYSERYGALFFRIISLNIHLYRYMYE